MQQKQKIAIAGLGAIGRRLVKELVSGALAGFELTAVAVGNKAVAEEFLSAAGASSVKICELGELPDQADIVVECLPPHLFDNLAEPVIRKGKTLIVMSASQLLTRDNLFDRANEFGAKIIVPSGAILGLDALKAVAEGDIRSVVIQTRKPPKGLAGAAYLQEAAIDIEALTEAKCILAGSVNEVAKHFPANVNVAAAISLAGLGADKTRMEVWADPALSRNTHQVIVESDSSDFTVSISNRPSEENPRTGKITAQSVLALLRSWHSNLKIGT